MITAKFTVREGRFCAYSVTGHSGFAERGSDIVCSAVSAVSIMTANTVSEVIKANAGIKSDGAAIEIVLFENNIEAGRLLKGLSMFLTELSRQYPDYLQVITEV